MSSGTTMTDEKDPRRPWRCEHIITVLVMTAVLLWALLSAAGCSTIRYIDREVVVHDTTKVIVRDSLHFYDRDSVFVKEKGDTVYIYKEKVRYRDRWHTDTLVRVRVDSVAVYQDKIVEVEKPLSAWQRLKIGGFWYLCGAVLVLLAWSTRKWWLRFFDDV